MNIELDNWDKKILEIIEKKPYKRYSINSLYEPKNHIATADEVEQVVDERRKRVYRLVELGLIREITLFCSPKARF